MELQKIHQLQFRKSKKKLYILTGNSNSIIVTQKRYPLVKNGKNEEKGTCENHF